MEMLVFISYCVLSYWAVGQTIYANKIQIGSLKDIFLTRFVLGVLLGLILIPVAILKKLFIHWDGRKNHERAIWNLWWQCRGYAETDDEAEPYVDEVVRIAANNGAKYNFDVSARRKILLEIWDEHINRSIESNPAGFLLRSPTGFFLPQTKDKAYWHWLIYWIRSCL